MKEVKEKLLNEYFKSYKGKSLKNIDWINENKKIVQTQIEKYKTNEDSYLKVENIKYLDENFVFLVYGQNFDLYIVIDYGLFSKNKWVKHNLFGNVDVKTNQTSLRTLLNHGFAINYHKICRENRNKKTVKNNISNNISELQKNEKSIKDKIKEVDEVQMKEYLIKNLVEPWIQEKLRPKINPVWEFRKKNLPGSEKNANKYNSFINPFSEVSKSTLFVYVSGEKENITGEVLDIEWNKSNPFEFKIYYEDDSLKPTNIRIHYQRKFLKLIDDFHIKYQQQKEVIKNITSVTKKLLDRDENNLLDVTELNDFEILIKEHQKDIISKGDYIQKFVKINIFFQKKSKLLNEMYLQILKGKNAKTVEETMKELNKGVQNYERLYVNSIIMINSLLDDDLINFYTLYEFYDEIGVFESNWEKTMKETQQQILNNTEITNLYLNHLSKQISEMETNITNSLDRLMNSNREMFMKLNYSICSRLEGINSQLIVNNVLTGIQTYQLYKINRNTKSLGR